MLYARLLYFQWLQKVIRNTLVYLSFFVSFLLCCMRRFWCFTDVENSYASSFPLSFHLRKHIVSVSSAKRTSCLQGKLHVCAGDVCESLFCLWTQLRLAVISGQNYTTEQTAHELAPKSLLLLSTQVTCDFFFPSQIWEQRSSVSQYLLPVFASYSSFLPLKPHIL